MIDNHSVSLAAEAALANLPLLTTEGQAMGSKIKRFSVNVAQSLRADALTDSERSKWRKLKGIGFTAAFGSEMTFGNELPVIGVAGAISEAATHIQPTGHPVIDAAIGGGLVAGTVYPFSYGQQMIYGKIAQKGLNRYPQTVNTISALANEKNTQVDDKDHVSDGNLAPVIGTTLAFAAHKAQHPESTPEQEDKVLKRGAKLIAGFWAAAFGVAATVTTGAEKIESSPVMQAIGSVRNPQVILPIAGGLYLMKEWYHLASNHIPKKPEKIDSPHQPVSKNISSLNPTQID
ncbi:hypothetical protein KC974_01155 [Candidatus Saccharibacteria bacterium]|nr:hypothetical protein [Candidatus Saccharibacteria bacterium]